jgi:hypothetical protein
MVPKLVSSSRISTRRERKRNAKKPNTVGLETRTDCSLSIVERFGLRILASVHHHRQSAVPTTSSFLRT